jgi:PilZ domain
MPERLRRSSRVQKRVPILLVGSDMEGRVFSEKTTTVVLSRHGAGIVSEYTLSAEQEVIIRLMETNKEAEVRVVGQLASQEGSHIYGIAFLDPNLDFWGIEFPPITEEEKAARRKILECSSCKSRETVEQTGVEADVFAINQGLMRYCQRCGSSTIWRLPSAASAPLEETLEAPEPSSGPRLVDAHLPRTSGGPASVTLVAEEPASASRESKPQARQENRRKHVRTKVNFKACVRSQSSTKDIVTCEDMSRGGLRFKSRRRYSEKQMIEVAAPYSPGSPSIFVSARIVFVQELAKEGLFRYGIAYTSDQSR